MIEAQLPPNWRALGPKHGLNFDLPQPSGAKVTDLAVPLRMLLYHIGTGASLKVTAATAAASKLADVSGVAVHKWMCRSGNYLAALLADMTHAPDLFAPDRWAGYDIVVVDASVVCAPGSDGTDARVHYAIRLSNLHVVDVQVTDETGGETFRRFSFGPGQLALGDRGYANPPGIASVVATGAAVLVRFNRGSLPLYYHGSRGRINVLEKLTKLKKPGAAREWAVEVHPAEGKPIRGRLCAVRLPADKANEARARLRREQGKDVTAESLAAADFVVVFTTIPKERLTTKQILELYCLRWQVELHIKRDKSICGLDKLPNFLPWTIRTWISGKLLLTEIARKISSPKVSIPPSAPCTAACHADLAS
jgi:hypothetical protein